MRAQMLLPFLAAFGLGSQCGDAFDVGKFARHLRIQPVGAFGAEIFFLLRKNPASCRFSQHHRRHLFAVELPSPSIVWIERARLKNRCASCSQVKPMPPCSWIMLLCAHEECIGAKAFGSVQRQRGFIRTFIHRAGRPIDRRARLLDFDHHVG